MWPESFVMLMVLNLRNRFVFVDMSIFYDGIIVFRFLKFMLAFQEILKQLIKGKGFIIWKMNQLNSNNFISPIKLFHQ